MASTRTDRGLSDVVAAVSARREQFGLTARDVDALASLQGGQCQRIESLERRPSLYALMWILKELGLQLVVSPDPDFVPPARKPKRTPGPRPKHCPLPRLFENAI
jgi:hypothetical protein